MPTVTANIAINAPPDEVWSLLCKINRYPKWDAFANEIMSASHSRLKAGATFQERSGRDLSDWKVTIFDPPNRQTHVGVVGFIGEVKREFLVEPDGEGATLQQTISFTVMPGVARPFGWLAEALFVKRFVRSRMVQSGEGLKALLASGG